jgi:hypothetical protein
MYGAGRRNGFPGLTMSDFIRIGGRERSGDELVPQFK